MEYNHATARARIFELKRTGAIQHYKQLYDQIPMVGASSFSKWLRHGQQQTAGDRIVAYLSTNYPGNVPRHQKIGSFNTDATQRETSINDGPRLRNYLLNDPIIDLHELSLATFTEVSSAKLFNGICHDLNYQFLQHNFKHYDRTVMMWDAEAYTYDEEESWQVSDVGKYLAIPLNPVGQPSTRIWHLGVHLPHKHGKQTAYTALLACLEELTADSEGVVVSGDFNCSPHTHFGEALDFAVEETIPTTKRGRSIDNIGVSRDTGVRLVQDSQSVTPCKFSHHKLDVSLAINL